MKTSKKLISLSVWLILFVLIWEAAAMVLSDILHDPLAEKKVPKLLTIAKSFLENYQVILNQSFITLSYAFSGLLIGTALGVILAITLRLSKTLEKAVLPYLLASQMVPILGLAPIMFGLFKNISACRVAICAYTTFFPVSLNMLLGLNSVPENLNSMMRVFGAKKFQIYKKLLIPFSLPYLFSGLKISAPVAISASILADTLSAKDGIGYVIIYTLYGAGTAGQFWPAIIVSALLGVLSFFAVNFIEAILLPKKIRVDEQ
ncbi:MAG: ABC transporter permease subunit [Clostridiaceae bacterium]|nr:ABC transporter permease subunit [Clostridiaceae bacterium]